MSSPISGPPRSVPATIAPGGVAVCPASHRTPAPASGSPIYLLAAMPAVAAPSDTDPVGAVSQSAAIRMVIVDDNQRFLDAARTLLEQEGADVVGTATTAAEALELAAVRRPDVILVDLDLGTESGFELAETLAAFDGASTVLISAYPEADLADLIAASPAAGFVSKSELSVSAVSHLLGRKDR